MKKILSVILCTSTSLFSSYHQPAEPVVIVDLDYNYSDKTKAVESAYERDGQTEFAIRIENGKTTFKKTITQKITYPAGSQEEWQAKWGSLPLEKEVTTPIEQASLPKETYERLMNGLSVARKRAQCARLVNDDYSQGALSCWGIRKNSRTHIGHNVRSLDNARAKTSSLGAIEAQQLDYYYTRCLLYGTMPENQDQKEK